MCRRSDLRTKEFTREAPTRWNPEQVINPSTQMPFLEDEAWAFVAETLEAGVALECIPLIKPKGKYAYVFIVPMGEGVSNLYVKLQLGNKIIGRSFHYERTLV